LPLIIDRLAYGVGYDTAGLATGERAVSGSLGRIAALAKSPAGIALGIGAAMTAVGVKAVAAASKWESSWSEVKTIMNGTSAEIGAMEQRVLGLTNIIPQDSSMLAKGYYQVLSSGISGASDSLFVLRTAAKAATGGLTSTFTAVDVITTILNAFGMQAREASGVADVLFTTVREGKITFEQLASNIGTAIPVWAQAGLQLEELAAAIATLTKGGFDAAIATTGLRAAMLSVVGAGDEAKQTAEKLGLAFTIGEIKAKGFVKWLGEFRDATEGNIELMKKLIPEQRALNVIMALAGNQYQEFARIVDVEVNGSLGSSQAAFEEMNNTLENHRKLLQNKISRQWVLFGNTVLGTANKIVEGLDSALFGDSMEDRLDQVTRLSGSQRRLTEDLEPMIARYQQLRNTQVRTVEETEELNTITRVLARTFPEAVTGLNAMGEALGFNIDLMRELRDASVDAISSELKERFREAADEMQRAEDRMGRVLRRFEDFQTARNRLEVDIARGGQRAARVPIRFDDPSDAMDAALRTAKLLAPLLTGTQGNITGVTVSLDALNDELKDRSLRDFVQTLRDGGRAFTEAELGTRIQEMFSSVASAREEAEFARKDFAELVDAFGVGKVILEWNDLRTAVDATGVETKRYREIIRTLENALPTVFGKDHIEESREKLGKLVLALRSIGVEYGLGIARVSPFPKPEDIAAGLQRAIASAQAKIDAERQRIVDFIAAETGEKFASAELEALAKANPEYIRIWEERLSDKLRLEEEHQKKVLAMQERLIASSMAIGPGGRLIPTRARAVPEGGTGMFGGLGGRMVGNLPEETTDSIELLADAAVDLGNAAGGAAGQLGSAIGAFLRIRGLASDLGEGGFDNLDKLSLGVAGIGAAVQLLGGMFQSGASAAEKMARSAQALEEFVTSIQESVGSELSSRKQGFDELFALMREVEQINKELVEADGDARIRLQSRLAVAMADLRRLAEQLGLAIPKELSDRDVARLKDLINEAFDELEHRIKQFANFALDTFEGAIGAARFEFELLDINDPAEQMERLLQIFKQFTGIDLSNLSPEDLERSMELFGQLITGSSGVPVQFLTGDPITDPIAMALNAANPMLQELADLLGVSIQEIVEILQKIEEGELTEEELKQLILDIESLGDQGAGGADDITTVSRTVGMTEEQGRTWIGIGNTQLLVMRAQEQLLADIAHNTRMALEGVEDTPTGVQEVSIYQTFTGTTDVATVRAATASGVRDAIGSKVRLRSAGKARRQTRSGL